MPEPSPVNLLLVLHNRVGFDPHGGTELPVRDYARALMAGANPEIETVYALFPEITPSAPQCMYRLRNLRDDSKETDERFVLKSPVTSESVRHDECAALFQQILREKQIALVHFWNLLQFPLSLPLVAQQSGVPVLVSQDISTDEELADRRRIIEEVLFYADATCERAAPTRENVEQFRLLYAEALAHYDTRTTLSAKALVRRNPQNDPATYGSGESPSEHTPALNKVEPTAPRRSLLIRTWGVLRNKGLCWTLQTAVQQIRQRLGRR